MKYWNPIQVRCYAGYRGEESPRAFRFREQEYSVSCVLSATNEQTMARQSIRRFRVLTTDHMEFALIQVVEGANWYVELEV
jgi:hypothetical protein